MTDVATPLLRVRARFERLTNSGRIGSAGERLQSEGAADQADERHRGKFVGRGKCGKDSGTEAIEPWMSTAVPDLDRQVPCNHGRDRSGEVIYVVLSFTPLDR